MQEEFAARIENEDVDGAMFQALAVNFTARKLANNFIAIIYYVENLVLHALA